MKINYVIIPLTVLATAFLGGNLTSRGMDWYKTIAKPAWTPPGSVIGTVWTILFILAAISALIFWNSQSSPSKKSLIVAVFIANAFLNIGWSWLFFKQHQIGLAALEAAALDVSVIALIILIWPISKIAAALLMPYAAWVAFATYLTYAVYGLNR